MSDPVWPTRWLDDPEAPPGAQDFVRSIERPSFVPPPVRRPTSAPPGTRWLGPTLATALVVGGLVLWRLTPSPASGPARVEETADETVAPPPDDAPAPLADVPADAPVDVSSVVASTARTEPVPRRTPDRAPEPGLVADGTETPETDAPPGLLSVMTSPASEVTVDGVLVGWTPILRLPLAPGPHTLTFVVGEAGIHETRIVTVRAGEASQLRVILPSGALGSVNIQTLPWARVFVDGRDTGRSTPVRDLRLPVGRHVLGLRTPDGELHEEVIEVPSDEALRIVRQW